MTENRNARRDDGDLLPDYPKPAQAGSSGGNLARTVGKRDEERRADGGDPEPTGVDKKDKIQPVTRTRADHKGASR